MCKTDSQWEPSIQHRELSSVLWGNLDGWGGGFKREGIYGHIRQIHFVVQQKLTQYSKVTIPRLIHPSIHLSIYLSIYLSICLSISLYGFPCGSEVRASARNAGDMGSIPGSGRSPGDGNGNPLQYSCLENTVDCGAWWATVHRVAKSWTRLRDFTFIYI